MQHPALEPQPRPALGRGRGVEPLVLDPPGRERGADRVDAALGRAVATPVAHAARHVEELGPGLVLDLAPQAQRLLREVEVLGLGVRRAVDARRPVRGAVRVPGCEALEQHDVAPAPGELPRRGRAHDAAPDHEVVDVLGAGGHARVTPSSAGRAGWSATPRRPRTPGPTAGAPRGRCRPRWRG
ncbi:Uncharacterised protein [Mycobacteroides abscessus]|nr:Uncharacterised protein [Mycobacteroides abscessus]